MKHADTPPAFPHLITFSENQGIVLQLFSRPSVLSLTRRPGCHLKSMAFCHTKTFRELIFGSLIEATGERCEHTILC